MRNSMLSASDFKGVIQPIYTSCGRETLASRQSSLREYSNDVKAALSILPPDVVSGVFKEYTIPTPEILNNVMNAMLTKEFVLENAAQGNNIDKTWLESGDRPRKIDESNLSSNDEWNSFGM